MHKLTSILGAVLFCALPLAALDHSAWDALLKRHVNSESRVDYRAWKNGASLAGLDAYLAQIASPWGGVATEERKAALVNAYNALTIRWILAHYPVESIWKTKQPFSRARHDVNGRRVSLDAIETELRQMGDPRIHAALVCAARGCPPLRREAYTAGHLDDQLDSNTRQWLSDAKLNSFDAQRRTARISSIFKWYRGDFPNLEQFLARYGPAGAAFLRQGTAKIAHVDYHWGLNDQSPLGESYKGGLGFYWDYLRNR
jgi:hypothetical protein